jgi:hypothetical protein
VCVVCCMHNTNTAGQQRQHIPVHLHTRTHVGTYKGTPRRYIQRYTSNHPRTPGHTFTAGAQQPPLPPPHTPVHRSKHRQQVPTLPHPPIFFFGRYSQEVSALVYLL